MLVDDVINRAETVPIDRERVVIIVGDLPPAQPRRQADVGDIQLVKNKFDRFTIPFNIVGIRESPAICAKAIHHLDIFI